MYIIELSVMMKYNLFLENKIDCGIIILNIMGAF